MQLQENSPRGSPYGIVANMLDCGLKFKLLLHYYVHFQTNTLGKGMNPLIPSAMV